MIKIETFAADGVALPRGNRNLDDKATKAQMTEGVNKAVVRAGKRCVLVKVGTVALAVVQGAVEFPKAPAVSGKVDRRDGAKPGIIELMCTTLRGAPKPGVTVEQLVQTLSTTFGRDPVGVTRTVRTQLSRLPQNDKKLRILKVRQDGRTHYRMPS